MADSVSLTLVGGPTALLDYGGLRLLTDPTFSPPGEYEVAPGRSLTKTEPPALAAPTDLDAVLLSHDQHPDNLDPAGRAVLDTAPLVITTIAAAGRLGGTARGLASGQSLRLPGGLVEITAVPAQHGPPGCEARTGDVTGFLLTGVDLPTVYVSGDNASIDIVRTIASRPIDIAVLFGGAARTSLFDGAPLTLTAIDAVEAARILDARRVVAIHVRGWAHFSEGSADVHAAFAAAGLVDRLVIPEPGKTVIL